MEAKLRGQTALPVILLISGLIMEFAVAAVFVNYFFSTSGLGEKLSSRAFAAAKAGIDDAAIKLAWDKEFLASPYNLTIDSDSAAISLSRQTDAHNNYIVTITSVGTAVSRQRKLVAIMVVDQTTGQLGFQSLTEQPAL